MKTSIAHAYGTVDCHVDALLALLRQLKAEEGADAVSVNDLVIKAVSVALQACPAVNCVWQGGQVRGRGGSHDTGVSCGAEELFVVSST